jgi:hypothetical protein
MGDTPSRRRYSPTVPIFARPIPAAWIKDDRWYWCGLLLNLGFGCRFLVTLVLAVLVAGCAAYGPYHANTSGEPFNSVRGPQDGRYKLAFIEFGDQGSMLDTSQLGAVATRPAAESTERWEWIRSRPAQSRIVRVVV